MSNFLFGFVETGWTVREIWYAEEQNELANCHLWIRFALIVGFAWSPNDVQVRQSWCACRTKIRPVSYYTWLETTRLVAVIGFTTTPNHASTNCNEPADECFVVKANAVSTYSRVSIVCDLRDFRSEKQACDVANGLCGQLYQWWSLYDLA